jgi:hypothetical protein
MRDVENAGWQLRLNALNLSVWVCGCCVCVYMCVSSSNGTDDFSYEAQQAVNSTNAKDLINNTFFFGQDREESWMRRILVRPLEGGGRIVIGDGNGSGAGRSGGIMIDN